MITVPMYTQLWNSSENVWVFGSNTLPPSSRVPGAGLPGPWLREAGAENPESVRGRNAFAGPWPWAPLLRAPLLLVPLPLSLPLPLLLFLLAPLLLLLLSLPQPQPALLPLLLSLLPRPLPTLPLPLTA